MTKKKVVAEKEAASEVVVASPVVPEVLQSQVHMAAGRNRALIADLGKRLIDMQQSLDAVRTDLEKFTIVEG